MRPETIQRARETLAIEYGFEIVNDTGRKALLVRVPKAKPDYLHDAAEVAFYVSEETLADIKDVLLVGHEKTARIEPRVLRDHIRQQAREDVELVEALRRRLDRTYGQTVQQSPSNFQHHAVALRIPKTSVAEFSPEDVVALRHVIQTGGSRVEPCQYGYIIADRDHERLGRRILLELAGEQPQPPAAAVAPIDPEPAYETPAPEAPAYAAPAYANAAAPAAQPANAPAFERDVHEEFEIVTRKAPAPRPEPAPAPMPAAASTEDHEEFEIITRKPAAAAPHLPEPAPAAPHAPTNGAVDDGDRVVMRQEKEYEVFTSKPKAPPATANATPAPGLGVNRYGVPTGPAPSKTKEYEIVSRPSAPPSAPLPMNLPPAAPPPATGHLAFPNAAPAAVVRDDPRVAPPARIPTLTHQPTAPAPAAPPARAPAIALPAADNGVQVVARVAPAHPEVALAAAFRAAGYEVVEGIKAQGTQFAFAAHRPEGGRRVLVKRAAEIDAEQAASLAALVTALGADVGIVVADRAAPGTRLATWGTRVEIVLAADVAELEL